MSDITRDNLPDRLRAMAADEMAGRNTGLSPGNSHDLLAAADEIELLCGYRDEAEAEASIASLAVQRLRLTDAELEALEAAARIIDAYEEEMDGFPSGAAATLRGLLKRLGGGA